MDKTVSDVGELQARIESLEAERDIWRERAFKGRDYHRDEDTGEYIGLEPWSDPTPKEIAARVEQNRKGRQE